MFTVVIPLFEKAPYIRRALDSVYAQSLPASEVIIVNDGSTDGGDLVAREFTPPPGLPGPIVIDQTNRGVSAARNTGIAAATQTWIAFLDADDRWAPGFLARMEELIRQFPGGALYGAGFQTVRDGRELRRFGVIEKEVLVGNAGGGEVDFFRALSREPVVSASSMAASREALDQVGGFPEGITHGEDLLLWAKLALAGPVVLAAEPLAKYDVSVPGQAVTYWQQGYRRDFEVLAYHRFLSEQLRLRADRPLDSFSRYARRQLEIAALQRLYWGNLPALAALVEGLGLDSLSLGWQGRAAAWVGRHKSCWPIAATMGGAARIIRESLQSCRRVLIR